MIKVDTTKRVQFSEFGGVGVLDIVEYEVPHPGPGEVLVEVLSAGINHIEALIREGGLIDELGDEFPQTQGNDFSGANLHADAVQRAHLAIGCVDIPQFKDWIATVHDAGVPR